MNKCGAILLYYMMYGGGPDVDTVTQKQKKMFLLTEADEVWLCKSDRLSWETFTLWGARRKKKTKSIWTSVHLLARRSTLQPLRASCAPEPTVCCCPTNELLHLPGSPLTVLYYMHNVIQQSLIVYLASEGGCSPVSLCLITSPSLSSCCV